MSKTNMKRRTFLKFSTLAGSGLLVGCSFSSTKIISNTNLPDAKLGMWVRIDEDEKINLFILAVLHAKSIFKVPFTFVA